MNYSKTSSITHRTKNYKQMKLKRWFETQRKVEVIQKETCYYNENHKQTGLEKN